MKKIQTIKGWGSKREAQVFYNKEFDEYFVKVYSLGGLRLMDEDYFSDDKEDAIRTAELIAGGTQ